MLAKAPTVFRGLRKIHLLLGTSVHKCGRKRRSALRLGTDTEAGSSLGDALVVPRHPVALSELLGRARRGYRPFVKLERGSPRRGDAILPTGVVCRSGPGEAKQQRRQLPGPNCAAPML
jgi:hypothetical protein